MHVIIILLFLILITLLFGSLAVQSTFKKLLFGVATVISLIITVGYAMKAFAYMIENKEILIILAVIGSYFIIKNSDKITLPKYRNIVVVVSSIIAIILFAIACNVVYTKAYNQPKYDITASSTDIVNAQNTNLDKIAATKIFNIDSFNGLGWGTKLPAKGYTLVYKSDYNEFYQRDSDQSMIENIKVDELTYTAKNGCFSEAHFLIYNKNDYRTIKSLCILALGNSHNSYNNSEMFEASSGSKSLKVVFKYNDSDDTGLINIRSGGRCR